MRWPTPGRIAPLNSGFPRDFNDRPMRTQIIRVSLPFLQWSGRRNRQKKYLSVNRRALVVTPGKLRFANHKVARKPLICNNYQRPRQD
jgi:hypothetical protein